ncbi:MAG: acyltransferase family protein [Clostridiaceae bacterium]
MIEYATFLRALAAILITNSHYTGVYPINIIASGGLLGDVMFFALSGFVLVNIKGNFVDWYKKRLIRIYPSIWIITLVYIVLGFYTFENWSIGSYFLYPTYYHFIASIVILYIPYYLIAKNDYLRNRVPLVMLSIFIIQLVIYLFFYDKTYYHIDTVREPMIRFLFFQSMLMGLYFRINHTKYVNNKNISDWIFLTIVLVVYFGAKIVFVRIEEISQFQIINQVTLFISLYFMFKCFAGIDEQLVKLPRILKTPVAFLAKITLQIYAVQYVIIPKFAHVVFPLNWLLITTSIVIVAYILFLVGTKSSDVIQKIVDSMILKVNKKEVA